MSARGDLVAYSARVAEALAHRYDLLRVLGRGGMSIVFLALDRHLGREVAIKVLDPAVCSDLGAERFLREVRIVAPLQHPNVLPLLDSGTVGQIVYSVMPYVEGESLRQRLVREGPLPIEEALVIALETAEGLHYAHRRGIIHRDIKPENILLSNGRGMIADFGIARAATLASELTLTGGGVPIGTPAYMSPEQVRGREAADARSDVYSLGCTLYEMLAGQPPFDGSSVQEVLRMHLEQEPAPLGRRRPELSDRVVGIVSRAMAKRPDDRYPSAGELADDLRALMGLPTRHPTPTGGGLTAERDAIRTSGSGLRPSGTGGWLVVGALVLALLAAAVTLGTPDRLPLVDRSVAVLPLVPEGGVAAPFLSEGLAREIGAALAVHPALRVTAHRSAVAAGGLGMPTAEAAETLGVAYLVTGTLSRDGPTAWRATLRLQQTSDAGTRWQRSYTVTEERLEATAAAVARDIATELLGNRAGELDLRVRPRPADLTSLLLRGRFWTMRGTAPAVAEAQRAFEQALAIAPGNASALAGLSWVHATAVVYGWPGSDLYTRLALAHRQALAAWAADSTDPDAVMALARTTHIAGTDLEAAARRYERVLALAPNASDALMELAQVVSRGGHADSAVALATRAVELDPLAAQLRHDAMVVALRARRPVLALEMARSRLAQDPADLIAQALEAFALVLTGRAAECADRPAGPWLASKATCLEAAGRAAEGQVLADSLRTLLEQEHYATVHQFAGLATWHAWRGEADSALVWLERGVLRAPFSSDWLLGSGLYDRVLDAPGFRDGLARIERLRTDRLALVLGRNGG